MKNIFLYSIEIIWNKNLDPEKWGNFCSRCWSEWMLNTRLFSVSLERKMFLRNNFFHLWNNFVQMSPFEARTGFMALRCKIYAFFGNICAKKSKLSGRTSSCPCPLLWYCVLLEWNSIRKIHWNLSTHRFCLVTLWRS